MCQTAHNLDASDLDELHAARESLARYATEIGEVLECGYSAESLSDVTSALEKLINEPLQ